MVISSSSSSFSSSSSSSSLLPPPPPSSLPLPPPPRLSLSHTLSLPPSLSPSTFCFVLVIHCLLSVVFSILIVLLLFITSYQQICNLN